MLNADFDYVKYLDTLKADGMPCTRVFTGSYVEPAGAFGIERELNVFDNLVREVQNEPWADHHEFGETHNPYLRDKTTFPNRIEVTTPKAVAWQAKVVEVIRAEEKPLPKKHLVFQNVANFRLPVKPAVDLAPGIDAVHFHYAHPPGATPGGFLFRNVTNCTTTRRAGSLTKAAAAGNE